MIRRMTLTGRGSGVFSCHRSGMPDAYVAAIATGGMHTFFCFVTAVGVVAVPRLPPTLPSRLSAAAGLMPPPGDGGGASPGPVLLRTDCSSGSPDCPDRSIEDAAAHQHT